MRQEEFDALSPGDFVNGVTGSFVVTERRPNGSLIAVQTRPIIDPGDWLCTVGRSSVHVMTEADRQKLSLGDWLRLQGGLTYCVGVPFSKTEGATAVCTVEISPIAAVDWDVCPRVQGDAR